MEREDVKEYYFYLDSTPTHSYMKYLYKYPQAAFPYIKLLEENRRRGRNDPEYELLDTGVFDEDRYFDVFVEYAKVDVEDILASDSRAANIGALQTRIKATGKITATQFAIILTIKGDVVTRFQMLEDSFDVSKAART